MLSDRFDDLLSLAKDFLEELLSSLFFDGSSSLSSSLLADRMAPRPEDLPNLPAVFLPEGDYPTPY